MEVGAPTLRSKVTRGTHLKTGLTTPWGPSMGRRQLAKTSLAIRLKCQIRRTHSLPLLAIPPASPVLHRNLAIQASLVIPTSLATPANLVIRANLATQANLVIRANLGIQASPATQASLATLASPATQLKRVTPSLPVPPRVTQVIQQARAATLRLCQLQATLQHKQLLVRTRQLVTRQPTPVVTAPPSHIRPMEQRLLIQVPPESPTRHPTRDSACEIVKATQETWPPSDPTQDSMPRTMPKR